MGEHRKLDGLSEYSAAIDEIVGLAVRHLMIFDYSLENMGFNGLPRYEGLKGFLLRNPENRLSIVVKSADYLDRYCPRMMLLLKRFSHNMAIHLTSPEIDSVYDPFCLADGIHYVRRFHFDDPRGVLGIGDPHQGGVLHQRFEQIWKASVPVLHADVTGL